MIILLTILALSTLATASINNIACRLSQMMLIALTATTAPLLLAIALINLRTYLKTKKQKNTADNWPKTKKILTALLTFTTANIILLLTSAITNNFILKSAITNNFISNIIIGLMMLTLSAALTIKIMHKIKETPNSLLIDYFTTALLPNLAILIVMTITWIIIEVPQTPYFAAALLAPFTTLLLYAICSRRQKEGKSTHHLLATANILPVILMITTLLLQPINC